MQGWWPIIFITLGTLAAGVVAIALLTGWKLSHPPRKPINMQPESFGITNYHSISFRSRRDKYLLHGWYIEAEQNNSESNGYTIIYAHGYGQNRLEPPLPALSLAAQMVEIGFDVLMFDFRNAGLSEGKVTTVGDKEQDDLVAAIDFVASHYPRQQVILHGFSMGAATSLMVAAKDIRVKAVIADSPFFSLSHYLREHLPTWTGLPAFPFNWLIMTLFPFILRADMKQVQPCQAVMRISPRPLLLIHGTGDDVIPHEHSLQLYALADQANTDLWLVKEAAHVRSYPSHPEEYVRRVRQFFLQRITK